ETVELLPGEIGCREGRDGQKKVRHKLKSCEKLGMLPEHPSPSATGRDYSTRTNRARCIHRYTANRTDWSACRTPQEQGPAQLWEAKFKKNSSTLFTTETRSTRRCTENPDDSVKSPCPPCRRGETGCLAVAGWALNG